LLGLYNEGAANPASSGISPTVTPELIERTTTLIFYARNPDDMTAGLSPCLAILQGCSESQAAENRSHVYAMVYSGNAAPSMETVLALTSDAPYMPQTSLHQIEMQACTQTVCKVHLGIDHLGTQAYKLFRKEF
jgi:hypothetical protein